MKADYPPLFTAGLHAMSLSELREKCVDAFPSSPTRAAIYDGLTKVIGALQIKGVSGSMWTDGSFVTEKDDPADSDVVFLVSGVEYDLMPGAKRDIVNWVRDNGPKASHLCDSYVLFEFPVGHALHFMSEMMRAYWQAQFGTSHRGSPKGMAVLTV